MLTSTPPPIPPTRPIDPHPHSHHSAPRTLLTTPQWSFHPSRFPPLPRKPSVKDLYSMFYSQRISNQRKRFANPSAFDQSWRRRSWRPLSTPEDIRQDDVRDLVGDAEELQLQARKRSRTDAAESAVAVFVGDVFGPEAGNGGWKEREVRIDSLVPKEEREEATQITREDSVVLHFAMELRELCLKDTESDGEDERIQHPPKPAPPHLQPQPPSATHKRRHSVHANPTTAHSLAAARADIMRIARTRNMSRPEISLRREIFFQEQYLRKHKRDGGTRAYRHMATSLTRNRRHLLAYKRRAPGLRDLPAHVRRRIEEFGGWDGAW